jgi:hypothetical protein
MFGRFVRVSALVIAISMSAGSTVAFACSATAPQSDLGLFGIGGLGMFILLTGVAIALRRNSATKAQPVSPDDSTTTFSARLSA